MTHQPSVTVYIADVLTKRGFRGFFTWLLAAGMAWGAVSKVGIARRHFQAWSDLGLLAWMPLVGTLEAVLALALVLRFTRIPALLIAAAYQSVWLIASWQIDDGHHVFRALGLLTLALLALVYGRSFSIGAGRLRPRRLWNQRGV